MKDKIKELLKLIKENPDLEILPCVCNELFGGDDYGDTLGEWGNAFIEEYCIYFGRYYNGKDAFIEDWMNDYEGELHELYGDNEKAKEKAAKEVADERFKKAIIVYIV